MGISNSHALRKREMLQRGVARVGLGAAAHFGLDARFLGVGCGFAFRAIVAAFLVLEKITLWALLRVFEMAIWTVKAIMGILEWVGATY